MNLENKDLIDAEKIALEEVEKIKSQKTSS